jgi:hypothetical protein
MENDLDLTDLQMTNDQWIILNVQQVGNDYLKIKNISITFIIITSQLSFKKTDSYTLTFSWLQELRSSYPSIFYEN